jgi:hypothetical protein
MIRGSLMAAIKQGLKIGEKDRFHSFRCPLYAAAGVSDLCDPRGGTKTALCCIMINVWQLTV